MTIVILLSMTFVPVYAVESDLMLGAQQVAESRISTYGSFTFVSSVSLYNTELELEAMCFNFSPCGYVIVNLNDYSVPEFSPSIISPYSASTSNTSRYVYIGPLNYYLYVSDNEFINLRTGSKVIKEDIKYDYSVESNADQRESALLTNPKARGSTLEFYTKSLPVTWSSDYFCGVDGCAIVLKYIDEHHESSLLDFNMDDNLELQKYLIEKKYIPNAATTAFDLVFGPFLSGYTGLNDFFRDRGSNFGAGWKPYLVTDPVDIVTSLEADLPVIIGTDPADDWGFGHHWIIIYGCVIGSESYFVINDGFGNNGIYVTIENDHYDSYVFFERLR